MPVKRQICSVFFSSPVVDDSVISAAAKDMEMSKTEALDCFEVLFAIVHGYASLIANNALEYDEASLRKTLDLVAEGLMGNK